MKAKNFQGFGRYIDEQLYLKLIMEILTTLEVGLPPPCPAFVSTLIINGLRCLPTFFKVCCKVAIYLSE